MAGSFLASSILGDFKVAEEFANFGLRADPGDFLLMNNLVVAKARQNEPTAAAIFAKIRPDDRLNEYTYQATRGLLKYAAGDEAGGAEDYTSAIKLATGEDTVLMVRASWLDTQARWAKAINQELFQRVNIDAAKPRHQMARGVALSALRLVRKRDEGVQSLSRLSKSI
jgi:hypothetical protein